MKYFKLGLALTMLIALTGCHEANSDRAYSDREEVTKVMRKEFAKEFQNFEFQEKIKSEDLLKSSRLFSGENATVIYLSDEVRDENFGQWHEQLSLDGLAKTNNGNYFTFKYESLVFVNDHPEAVMRIYRTCLEIECRSFSGSTVSQSEAEVIYFESKQFDKDRFKEFFGKDAPPKTIPG